MVLQLLALSIYELKSRHLLLPCTISAGIHASIRTELMQQWSHLWWWTIQHKFCTAAKAVGTACPSRGCHENWRNDGLEL
mmetsp:Transcript_15314/g.36524  ORF Transcript_15314/g.36524 Transcript_15314/m.36524 type:complete len:80 (-) Transcript_15314:377-616(-)